MNLFDLLKEYAGMSREEAEHYFSIENTAEEWTMKSIRYLEIAKFKAVLTLAYEYGGTYDPKAKGSVIHIPKESVPKPVMNEQGILSEPSHENEKLEEALGHKPPETANVSKSAPEKFETAEEYALSRSLKGKLGQLVPCLEDAEGRIFDGVHRKAIDPKAWTVKLDKVKTPVDRALARMTVNFCRRHYTPEEMKNDIGLLIGSGLTMEQIIESTGISESTIYKYKPQELKNQVRVEAGKEAHRISQDIAPSSEVTVKTQETVVQTPTFKRIEKETLNELVECANCHMGFHISRATLIDDKNYCPRCAEHVKPQPKPKIEPTPFKPKETGEYRKALMHPQKSKFELAVIQELQAEGLPLETDREFCVQKTIPDAILKLKDRTIAIYIDCAATHKEGNERDEWLRGQLERLYDVKVLPIQYKTDTKEEVQRAKEQIREFLKW
ncbi:hypothetical protein MUP01_10890 [Candidatus Bathyarchaeota archaeon]|nr:hypothetical protein [Candidatus Bathyarchaeota archaeon]